MSKENNSSSILFTRRSFMLGIAASGAGVALSVVPGSRHLLAQQQTVAASFEPNVWLRVDPDGTVTVTVSKSEMGQGIRTTFAMIVAEELDADWSSVKVRQARPDTGNGSLGTGGSGSTVGSYNTLRRAGATARAMFVSAAAKQWGVAENTCSVTAGVVRESAGGRQLRFAELTDAAAAIPVPSNPTLKNASAFKIIGTRKPHIDAADIVSGTAQYGLDVRVPNMKYAILALPPTLGGSVRTLDATAALAIKGVLRAERVSNIPGVVIVAENTYAAIQGRDALTITWNAPNAALNSDTMFTQMKNAIGSVPDVPASSATKIEAIYQLPYLAHATMEPMNCVADVRTDSAEIWAPTQSGDSVLNAVMSATGLAASKIRVNTTLMGGGFGRRSQTEYASYAARISALNKTPILFMYTRQDDMRNDGYRPATYHVLKGGLNADGSVSGWNQRCVPSGMAYNPPYSVSPTTQGGTSGVSFPVPTGAWRSVSNSTAVFANECFIDELAFAAAKDPYQFRRGLLGAGRLRTVLDEAATRSEWTKPLPKGWGRGIAITDCYSYIAHVVEVSVSDMGILKVERVVIVVDCGTAVNPMGVEAQLQGACVDALATALKAEISVEAGSVKQRNFAQYDWIRMNEMPKIEVHILPSTQSPRGMGEAGFPSVSPALCNAIFNATGKRLRTLPIQKNFLADVHIPENEDAANCQVFPNPCTTGFDVSGTFKHPVGQHANIVVRNLLGANVVETTADVDAHGQFTARVEFPPTADAAYLVSIQNGNSVLTRTVVKQ